VSLDFADTFTDIDYILLMDTNDELRGGEKLCSYCETYKNKKNTGFLLSQEWFSGNKYDKYYNMRMVKPRQGWRYFGRVHEWMKNTRFETDAESREAGDVVIRLEDVVLFQDRTLDDKKSFHRFKRDKVLLLEDHKQNPKDPRILFYLGQTLSCLNEKEDAYYYYKIRNTLEGFWEEKFHSYLRCGEISQQFNNPWEETMKWYIKAFEFSPRAEPLINIAEHYSKNKNWLLCFAFTNLACSLDYPKESLLFIDKNRYDYKRWHLLGICGWYTKNYKEGKIGCLKAISTGQNIELDKNNLKFYTQLEENQS
jgi:hypothetical protein